MEPYTIALCAFPYFTSRHREQLLFCFENDAERAWNASVHEYGRAGISPKLAELFTAWRKTYNVGGALAIMEAEGIRYIPKNSIEYPPLLHQIPDAPLALFIRGVLPSHTATILAVVGTRKPSLYGSTVTTRITRVVATQGIVIVSGMALGIDALAHRAALASGTQTLAVLAGGIDNATIYPRAHYRLAHDILKHGGALITEYAPGTPPLKHSFPIRNRIIAGMAHGALITEGALNSGSLITAQCALDYNREVFACPHQLYVPNGEGPNKLIAAGAHPVLGVHTINEVLGIRIPKQSIQTVAMLADPLEKQIIELCTRKPLTTSELARTLNIKANKISALISSLEIQGLIEERNGIIVSHVFET